MTSQTNGRELDRLRTARAGAQDRFARQMRLLEQIEATAVELDKITARWRAQLTALVELSGGATPASALSGLPKTDLDVAAKNADRSAVDAAVAGATSRVRRSRPTGATTADGAMSRRP